MKLIGVADHQESAMAKKAAAKKFKVGDWVSWTSQARGNHTTKLGTVIEVVFEDELPKTLNHYGKRRVVSYVVEVVPAGTNPNRPRKAVRYWPVPSLLRGATRRVSSDPG
jgi:hypothetical protein